MAEGSTETKNARKVALQLIVLFGIVSLCGDIVYEGARSVNGPYLKTLGANAAMVGLIVGIGEFLGYFIRLISGYFADKTKAYWVFTITGYGMLISVPLLALTGVWQVAAVLMVLERIGKALRNPSKDTILSQATKVVGTGVGFGINEALDQIGAIIGPVIFTVLFATKGSGTLADYQKGYSLLWIPFALVMISVFVAFIRVPNPEMLESTTVRKNESENITKVFWIYTIFTFVTTIGFANFAILGYHFKAQQVLTDTEIPLYYAIAMGVDALVALIIGKLYDVAKAKKKSETGGLITLIVIPILTAFIPILGFTKSKGLAISAVILWGVVMGTHETVMKSAIADITPMKKRGTGYGVFNTAYGLALLAGSALMGLLYDISINGIIILSVVAEIIAIPLFFIMRKEAIAREAS
ncbi:MAG TPA: MFS transporter [Spirochaetia bacterium]|nr:MFS transporter [Spirochaetia bacterium]